MSDLVPKKELTPMQESFLEHLFSPEINGNVRAAMDLAGYSENTATKEVIGPLKEHIIELTNTYLAMNGPKAAVGLVNVIDSPNTLGAANKLKAAESVLDRIGITKKNDDAMKLPQGAIVFLPPKEKTDITIRTGPEKPEPKVIDS